MASPPSPNDAPLVTVVTDTEVEQAPANPAAITAFTKAVVDADSFIVGLMR